MSKKVSADYIKGWDLYCNQTLIGRNVSVAGDGVIKYTSKRNGLTGVIHLPVGGRSAYHVVKRGVVSTPIAQAESVEVNAALNEKIETRDGRIVTLLCTSKGRGRNPVKGYIGNEDTITSWRADGTKYGNGVSHSLDLFVVREGATEDISLSDVVFESIFEARLKATIKSMCDENPCLNAEWLENKVRKIAESVKNDPDI